MPDDTNTKLTQDEAPVKPAITSLDDIPSAINGETDDTDNTRENEIDEKEPTDADLEEIEETKEEVRENGTESSEVTTQSFAETKPDDREDREDDDVDEDSHPDAGEEKQEEVDEVEETDDEGKMDEAETPETAKALSIMQVEDLLNRQMTDIAKLRDEVKQYKSAFDDSFKNDAKFREIDEKVKEAGKLKKDYQTAMLKDPSISAAQQKFLEKRDELKDLQLGLSDYLREYHRVSGMEQFETKDGEILHIVQVYKLVKK